MTLQVVILGASCLLTMFIDVLKKKKNAERTYVGAAVISLYRKLAFTTRSLRVYNPQLE